MSLSVIVPFYNEVIYFEQTIRATLKIGDALKEIVVVNDNPEGEYSKFLNQLAAIDSRIIIHKNSKNSGAAQSRNHGLKKSSGQYVIFLDGDDYLSPLSIREALNHSASTEADMTLLPTLIAAQDSGTYHKMGRDKALFTKKLKGLTVDNFPQIRFGTIYLLRRDFLINEDIHYDTRQRKFEDHLYIITASQKAKRISTFDKWTYVWRHRGGSLSSSSMNIEDFRMQIASIKKSLVFLRSHYEDTHPDFQRDLAFCFSRYLSNWPILTECLPYWETSSQSADILEEIAKSLSPYQLQAGIETDTILQRIFGNSLTLRTGKSIAVSQLPMLYRLIVSQDWNRLADEIGLKTHDKQIGGAREHQKCPFELALEPAKEKGGCKIPLTLNLKCPPVDSQSPPVPELSARIIQGQKVELGVQDPSALLWEAFSKRFDAPNQTENRLFSEFVLDEIESLIALVNLGANEIDALGGLVNIKLTSGKTPLNFDTLTKAVFTSKIGEPQNEKNTHQAYPNFNDAMLAQALQAACGTTERYVRSKINISSDQSQSISNSDVAVSWRAAENLIISDLELRLAERHTQLADSARFGDADWFGQRTWKSRIRFVLSKHLGLSS